jgi:hypothetical protein
LRIAWLTSRQLPSALMTPLRSRPGWSVSSPGAGIVEAGQALALTSSLTISTLVVRQRGEHVAVGCEHQQTFPQGL